MAHSNQAQEQATLEMQDPEQPNNTNLENVDELEIINYSERAQWLRAAILGANDGLLSTASLMVSVGAVRDDSKTMVLAGIAGLVAGASSMAIGEFVSVYSQYDIEMSQITRQNSRFSEKCKGLPSPFKAASASAISFSMGAAVPLLSGGFVDEYRVRLGVVAAAVSLALVGSGAVSAYLGRAPMVKSCFRVLCGGWVAMGITFGLTKSIGLFGI